MDDATCARKDVGNTRLIAQLAHFALREVFTGEPDPSAAARLLAAADVGASEKNGGPSSSKHGRDDAKRTVMMHAARAGYVDLTAALIALSHHRDIAECAGSLPSNYIPDWLGGTQRSKTSARRESDVGAGDVRGWIGMHHAAMEGHCAVLALLLDEAASALGARGRRLALGSTDLQGPRGCVHSLSAPRRL